MKVSQDSKLEEMKANQISQDQFEAKLEEMKLSQDQKLEDIKGQIKDQLNCVINEMKGEMENRMEALEEKVTKTIEEVTGRICGVEETVQNLQGEVIEGNCSYQLKFLLH